MTRSTPTCSKPTAPCSASPKTRHCNSFCVISKLQNYPNLTPNPFVLSSGRAWRGPVSKDHSERGARPSIRRFGIVYPERPPQVAADGLSHYSGRTVYVVGIHSKQPPKPLQNPPQPET